MILNPLRCLVLKAKIRFSFSLEIRFCPLEISSGLRQWPIKTPNSAEILGQIPVDWSLISMMLLQELPWARGKQMLTTQLRADLIKNDSIVSPLQFTAGRQFVDQCQQ